MPTKSSILAWLRERPWAMYGLVFLALLLIHCVIFREIIGQLPALASGKSVIARDELIPFFDFNAQFWPESTAGLTSSEEVRVVYSFWTAWVRYYAVLPFAIIIMNTVSAFILFYAFYRIGRHFAPTRAMAIMFMAALSSFLVHFILLYAKITHFYTLVFGFALFALAMSFMLEQLFFKRNLGKGNVAIVTLLVLLNPAIHYHVIFHFIFTFFVLLHCLINLAMNRKYAGFYLKRNLIYFGIITALSLIPYAVFIYLASGGSTEASANIPSNYWMIYYSSVAITSLFSLDTAAPIDMFRYGSYFVPSPRIATMIVIFLIGSIFTVGRWKTLHIGKRIFVLTLFTALLLASWMAIGYTTSFSFHALIGNVALYLINQASMAAQLAGKGIVTFVNILRFPHRFQFIFYYVAGILFTLALLWLYDAIRQKQKAVVAAGAAMLVAMAPILLARDYFMVLTTGNFASFMQPYHISPDLGNIRSQLASKTNNLVFILPSLESGRDLNADGKKYNFIDKFLIYYLNQPTLYYGTGGNPDHKAISYAVYRALEDNQPWWDDVLVNSLGITHLLVLKQTEQRPVGVSYMPNIDKAIPERLSDSPLFRKAYDGPDFALYEATQQPSDKHQLVDMQWSQLSEQLANQPAQDKLYFPMQLKDFASTNQEATVLTTSLERSFYNLYTIRHQGSIFYPSVAQLAFSEDLIASSNFTNSALSMSKLNNKYDDYNYIGERMPSLLNTLTTQFVGVPAGNAGITLQVKAPEDGSYRLLLHAASRAETIIGAADNRGIVFQKIDDDKQQQEDYLDLTYFYVDIDLAQGSNTITLHNPGDHALVVESITLMPSGDLPASFDGGTNQAGIQISPTDQTNVFNVKMEDQQ